MERPQKNIKDRLESDDEEEYSEYSTTSSTNDSFFLNYMKNSDGKFFFSKTPTENKQ